MEGFLLVAVLFGGVIVFGVKGRPKRRTPDRTTNTPVSAPSEQRLRLDAAPSRRTVPENRSDAKTALPLAPKPVVTGKAYVIDGDTLVINQTRIRLFGIDAPEMNHPYGQKAKWALVTLCKGQAVRAEISAEDGHGRTVARCFLPDGRDLSAEMVKQGLALDWPKFSGGMYRTFEGADARRRMWLADARQKGRMHVWEKFEMTQQARQVARR